MCHKPLQTISLGRSVGPVRKAVGYMQGWATFCHKMLLGFVFHLLSVLYADYPSYAQCGSDQPGGSADGCCECKKRTKVLCCAHAGKEQTQYVALAMLVKEWEAILGFELRQEVAARQQWNLFHIDFISCRQNDLVNYQC